MVSWLCVWAAIAGIGIGGLWLKFADRDIPLWLVQIFRRQHPEAFAGKVVWITGASRGLGERLARHFAQKGAKLILSSRDADHLQVLLPSCQCLCTHLFLESGRCMR